MIRSTDRLAPSRCSLVVLAAAYAIAGCGSGEEQSDAQAPPAYSGNLLLPGAASPASTKLALSPTATPSNAEQPSATSGPPATTNEDATRSIDGNVSSANAPATGNDGDGNATVRPAEPSDAPVDAAPTGEEQPVDNPQPAEQAPPAPDQPPVVDELPPVDEQPPSPDPVELPPVEDPPTLPPAPGDVGSIFFSDSFEGSRRPEWEESLNGGGTFSLDASQGANGTGSSMRVDATGFHTMLQYPLPDAIVASNQYFGRVHLRMEQAPQGHVTWIETGIRTQEFGRGNDEFEVRIGYNLGVLDLNRFPSDAEIRDPNTTITPNAWHCVQFFFDGNPEQARVWFDGVETALSTTDFTRQGEGAVDNNQQPVTGWIPPLEAIRFGWELNGNTIWIDEVALSTEFVDCQ